MKMRAEIREVAEMQFLVALIISIPFIAFPVLLWQLGIDGRLSNIRKQGKLLNNPNGRI